VTPLKLARTIAELAADKKAEDILILNMRKVANFCDFFIVCTGTSDRHVKAIADGIDDGLYLQGIKTRRASGRKDSRWVILDLGNVVAHIFDRDAREFYGLDYLWQEAKAVPWPK
jgi:ribosome-associated protein